MGNYEAIFIIKPELKEEELKGVLKGIADSVTKHGGGVKKEDDWGKRQLAYRLKKLREGHYYKLDFEAPSEAIAKMEAAYKLNQSIVRVMITKR